MGRSEPRDRAIHLTAAIDNQKKKQGLSPSHPSNGPCILNLVKSLHQPLLVGIPWNSMCSGCSVGKDLLKVRRWDDPKIESIEAHQKSIRKFYEISWFWMLDLSLGISWRCHFGVLVELVWYKKILHSMCFEDKMKNYTYTPIHFIQLEKVQAEPQKRKRGCHGWIPVLNDVQCDFEQQSFTSLETWINFRL